MRLVVMASSIPQYSFNRETNLCRPKSFKGTTQVVQGGYTLQGRYCRPQPLGVPSNLRRGQLVAKKHQVLQASTNSTDTNENQEPAARDAATSDIMLGPLAISWNEFHRMLLPAAASLAIWSTLDGVGLFTLLYVLARYILPVAAIAACTNSIAKSWGKLSGTSFGLLSVHAFLKHYPKLWGASEMVRGHFSYPLVNYDLELPRHVLQWILKHRALGDILTAAALVVGVSLALTAVGSIIVKNAARMAVEWASKGDSQGTKLASGTVEAASSTRDQGTASHYMPNFQVLSSTAITPWTSPYEAVSKVIAEHAWRSKLTKEAAAASTAANKKREQAAVLQEMRDGAQREARERSAEVEGLRESRAELQEELKLMKARHEGLQDSLGASERRVEHLRSELTTARSQLATLRSLEVELEEGLAAKAKSDELIGGLKAEVARLKETLQQVQQEEEASNSDSPAPTSELDLAGIVQLQADLRDAEAYVEELLQAQEDSMVAQAELNDAIEERDEEIGTLREEVEGLESALSELRELLELDDDVEADVIAEEVQRVIQQGQETIREQRDEADALRLSSSLLEEERDGWKEASEQEGEKLKRKTAEMQAQEQIHARQMEAASKSLARMEAKYEWLKKEKEKDAQTHRVSQHCLEASHREVVQELHKTAAEGRDKLDALLTQHQQLERRAQRSAQLLLRLQAELAARERDAGLWRRSLDNATWRAEAAAAAKEKLAGEFESLRAELEAKAEEREAWLRAELESSRERERRTKEAFRKVIGVESIYAAIIAEAVKPEVIARMKARREEEQQAKDSAILVEPAVEDGTSPDDDRSAAAAASDLPEAEPEPAVDAEPATDHEVVVEAAEGSSAGEAPVETEATPSLPYVKVNFELVHEHESQAQSVEMPEELRPPAVAEQPEAAVGSGAELGPELSPETELPAMRGDLAELSPEIEAPMKTAELSDAARAELELAAREAEAFLRAMDALASHLPATMWNGMQPARRIYATRMWEAVERITKRFLDCYGWAKEPLVHTALREALRDLSAAAYMASTDLFAMYDKASSGSMTEAQRSETSALMKVGNFLSSTHHQLDEGGAWYAQKAYAPLAELVSNVYERGSSITGYSRFAVIYELLTCVKKVYIRDTLEALPEEQRRPFAQQLYSCLPLSCILLVKEAVGAASVSELIPPEADAEASAGSADVAEDESAVFDAEPVVLAGGLDGEDDAAEERESAAEASEEDSEAEFEAKAELSDWEEEEDTEYDSARDSENESELDSDAEVEDEDDQEHASSSSSSDSSVEYESADESELDSDAEGELSEVEDEDEEGEGDVSSGSESSGEYGSSKDSEDEAELEAEAESSDSESDDEKEQDEDSTSGSDSEVVVEVESSEDSEDEAELGSGAEVKYEEEEDSDSDTDSDAEDKVIEVEVVFESADEEDSDVDESGSAAEDSSSDSSEDLAAEGQGSSSESESSEDSAAEGLGSSADSDEQGDSDSDEEVEHAGNGAAAVKAPAGNADAAVFAAAGKVPADWEKVAQITFPKESGWWACQCGHQLVDWKQSNLSPTYRKLQPLQPRLGKATPVTFRTFKHTLSVDDNDKGTYIEGLLFKDVSCPACGKTVGCLARVKNSFKQEDAVAVRSDLMTLMEARAMIKEARRA